MVSSEDRPRQEWGLTIRPRRLRHLPAIRRMVRHIRLHPDNLICPVFVTHGQGVRREITSMPGQFQLSVDLLGEEIAELSELNIPAVMLFGIPAHKDPLGTGAYATDGIIQQAIERIKQSVPEMVIITDVCLCEYTNHGHCGVVHDGGEDAGYERCPPGYVRNDATLELLQRIAVSHACRGADIVAPSGMMDGMVSAIRAALDARGFSHVGIMSYSIKYSSAFYGPFRDAAEGAPQFGDRKTHQMDYAECRQALTEARLDVEQGADFLMVKPALSYLDVIARVRDHFPEMPLVAYNVSGEYSMVKAAALHGWLDEKETVLEMLTSFQRAGAELIITYHAKDVAKWLTPVI